MMQRTSKGGSAGNHARGTRPSSARVGMHTTLLSAFCACCLQHPNRRTGSPGSVWLPLCLAIALISYNMDVHTCWFTSWWRELQLELPLKFSHWPDLIPRAPSPWASALLLDAQPYHLAPLQGRHPLKQSIR